MQYSTSDTFDGRPCLALSLSFSLAHRNNAASSAGAFELLVSSAKPFDAFASFVLAPPDRRLPRVKLGSVASSKQRRERPRLQSLIGDKNKCVPVEIVSSGLFSQSLSRARSKSTITKKRARAGAAKTSPTTTTVPAAAATAVAGVVPGLPGARKPRTKSSLVFFDRCSKMFAQFYTCKDDEQALEFDYGQTLWTAYDALVDGNASALEGTYGARRVGVLQQLREAASHPDAHFFFAGRAETPSARQASTQSPTQHSHSTPSPTPSSPARSASPTRSVSPTPTAKRRKLKGDRTPRRHWSEFITSRDVEKMIEILDADPQSTWQTVAALLSRAFDRPRAADQCRHAMGKYLHSALLPWSDAERDALIALLRHAHENRQQPMSWRRLAFKLAAQHNSFTSRDPYSVKKMAQNTPGMPDSSFVEG